MVHFLTAGQIVCVVFSLQGCEALQSKSELSHNSGSYAHVQFYIFLFSPCSKQGCSFSKLYCKYNVMHVGLQNLYAIQLLLFLL